MIPRVYIDTSVIGGCFDPEYREESNQLWSEFKTAKKTLVVSDLVLLELEEAPKRVRQLLDELPSKFIEFVGLDEESIA